MVPVRQDKSPQELRLSAKAAKDGKVVQRLLGIALILDGRGRSAGSFDSDYFRLHHMPGRG